MERKKRAPNHPGGILCRQYLEPLELTVSELAKILGVSRRIGVASCILYDFNKRADLRVIFPQSEFFDGRG